MSLTLSARLAAVLVAVTVLQIVLGAVVRLTDSGLSCPDWPLCYGLWLPTPGKLAALPNVDYSFGQVMLEWLHRLNAAALIGPLTVILAVVAYRARHAAPVVWRLMPPTLILLAIQAGLGGLTVLDRNSPWSVAIHLGTALLFLTCLLWAYWATRPRVAAPIDRPAVKPLVGLTAVAALATIASGAMVAKSGASLACPSWPLCDGALIPPLSDPAVQYNFGHRVLALVTAGLVVLVWRLGRRTDAPLFRRLAAWALIAVAAQVVLGAGVVGVFSSNSLSAQVAVGAGHQALAVLAFGFIVSAWWATFARPGAPGD